MQSSVGIVPEQGVLDVLEVGRPDRAVHLVDGGPSLAPSPSSYVKFPETTDSV
jgi:hypothetical protein